MPNVKKKRQSDLVKLKAARAKLLQALRAIQRIPDRPPWLKKSEHKIAGSLHELDGIIADFKRATEQGRTP